MTAARVIGGKTVAATSDMRACALLVFSGCLVTTEGPVIVSSDPIIAIAANDHGIVWAEQTAGRGVNLWALERGVFQVKIGSVVVLDRLAVVRREVYASAGTETEIVGAQGHFLVLRTGDVITAFDPEPTALDHDPWIRTYPATSDAGVGHGRLALGSANGWRTHELGGMASATHAVGAHAPTLVRPIADGIAFACADGLFTSRRGELAPAAEPDHWRHLVELDGVLWAATGSRLIRIDDGVSTELDVPGDVVDLAVGGGRLYLATEHAIYRAD